MSIRRLVICLSLVFLSVVLIGIAFRLQLSSQGTGPTPTIIAGRNANMVSGTKLPWGDPWLQRQNEPSIAVSSRNPMHLFAGANDYRTIDMDFPNQQVPGIPIQVAAARDAWLGIYKSFDGGQSWITTLLPGYPQDASSEGLNSPIHGFDTACDPCVRAGTNGMFYYSGIAFNRNQRAGAVFVARFIDNNNLEKVRRDAAQRPVKDSVQYLDTRVIGTGNPGQFLDMPSIAVDIPRTGSGSNVINGQNIPNANIYIAYTLFPGSTATDVRSKLYFSKSTNSGKTWSGPIKLSENQQVVQRAVIAIDPGDPSGRTIYIAFRRFKLDPVPDAMVVVKSSDGGKTFTKPIVIATLSYPFDQLMNANRFRTNAHPSIAVDQSGFVYVAWAERRNRVSGVADPLGQARIVVAKSRNGLTWNAPMPVELTGAEGPLDGHQVMPALACAGGRLLLTWYDQRDSLAKETGGSVTAFLEDVPGAPRHTVDVRAAEWRLNGQDLWFSPSWQVSRYLFYLTLAPGENPPDVDYPVKQAEYNTVNFPLFQQGTRPFHGDFLDIAASPLVLPPPVAGGSSWAFNKNPFEPTSFHAAWTDNRDVRPPNGNVWGDWVTYTPPNSNQDAFDLGQTNACANNGTDAGKRNQNVYTASLSQGVIVGSPANTKQLDVPGGSSIHGGRRTFVVFVRNLLDVGKTFTLTFDTGIPQHPSASFRQDGNQASRNLTVGPFSSASVTVYVDQSSFQLAPVKVDVHDGNAGGSLVGYVLLNPDATNLSVIKPDTGSNPLGNEDHTPDVSNPKVWKYKFGDASEPNPGFVSPRVQNPRVQNSGYVNPRVQNVDLENPRVQNKSETNQNLIDFEAGNPRVQNPRVQNTALTDMTWTVTNNGNTTSTYSFDVVAQDTTQTQLTSYFADGYLYGQVLVYKLHTTPVDQGCILMEEHHDELVVNVTNPRVQNPRVQNIAPTSSVKPLSAAAEASASSVEPDIGADDVTFFLAPGEQAYVIFRVYDKDTTDGFDFTPQEVAADVAAEAVNTGADTPVIVEQPDIPWQTPLPQIASTPASLSFVAYLGYTPPAQSLNIYNSGGGTLSYTVTSDASWLSVAGPSGSGSYQVSVNISRLDLTTYTGFLIITDPVAANNPLRVPVSLDVQSAPPLLFITTTSIPDGIKGADYGALLQTTGGLSPVTWSILSGALPSGLVLNPTAGSIIGSPTGSGFFSFTAQAEDAFHQKVSVTLSMTIADWVARYNGTANGNDQAIAVAVDSSGSVYVTGASQGSGTDYDYATVKYDSNANPLWVARYNGPGNGVDRASAVAVDPLGNVYVTGNSQGSGTDYDYATTKYDSNGNQLWVARYNGDANGVDYVNALAVDSSGYVYVTGGSGLGAAGQNYATVKYDSNGNQLWVAKYSGDPGGNQEAFAIAIDPLGNVYVTGGSWGGVAVNQDFATVKYDKDGNQLWVARYNGPGSYGDVAHCIAVDPLGNVYVAGGSSSTGSGNWAYATVKYDSNGNQLWAKRYSVVANSSDTIEALAVDSSGNVYVTGQSQGSGGDYDYATVKYDSNGNQLWVARYNGPGNGSDWATNLAVDSLGNVYVTGESQGSGTVNHDYATVKYAQVFPDTLIITTQALDIGYVGTPYAKALWAFGGSGSRTWSITGGSLPLGLDLSPITGVIAGTPTSPGTYNFTVHVVDGSHTDTKSLIMTIGAVYELVGTFGSSGSGDGQFGVPFGIAIDPSGNVYVSDDGNQRIQKFDSGGAFLGWWGLDDHGNTGWHGPGSGRTGVAGDGDGQFNRPLGIAVDGGGMVYVTDTQNMRVQKFDSTGGYLSQWGGSDGGFSWPIGIAADTFGFIYVCDTFHNLIWQFTSSGEYLSTQSVAISPRGIAFDPSQSCFYVSDQGDAPWQNVAIKKFTSNWEFVTSWGSFGSGDSQFNEIGYPFVSNTGRIYVPDSMNNRVQVFSLDGKLLAKIGGSPGWGSPWGIAINNSLGYIYITDQYNSKVQIWRKVG